MPIWFPGACRGLHGTPPCRPVKWCNRCQRRNEQGWGWWPSRPAPIALYLSCSRSVVRDALWSDRNLTEKSCHGAQPTIRGDDRKVDASGDRLASVRRHQLPVPAGAVVVTIDRAHQPELMSRELLMHTRYHSMQPIGSLRSDEWIHI